MKISSNRPKIITFTVLIVLVLVGFGFKYYLEMAKLAEITNFDKCRCSWLPNPRKLSCDAV